MDSTETPVPSSKLKILGIIGGCILVLTLISYILFSNKKNQKKLKRKHKKRDKRKNKKKYKKVNMPRPSP